MEDNKIHIFSNHIDDKIANPALRTIRRAPYFLFSESQSPLSSCLFVRHLDPQIVHNSLNTPYPFSLSDSIGWTGPSNFS